MKNIERNRKSNIPVEVVKASFSSFDIFSKVQTKQVGFRKKQLSNEKGELAYTENDIKVEYFPKGVKPPKGFRPIENDDRSNPIVKKWKHTFPIISLVETTESGEETVEIVVTEENFSNEAVTNFINASIALFDELVLKIPPANN